MVDLRPGCRIASPRRKLNESAAPENPQFPIKKFCSADIVQGAPNLSLGWKNNKYEKNVYHLKLCKNELL